MRATAHEAGSLLGLQCFDWRGKGGGTPRRAKKSQTSRSSSASSVTTPLIGWTRAFRKCSRSSPMLRSRKTESCRLFLLKDARLWSCTCAQHRPAPISCGMQRVLDSEFQKRKSDLRRAQASGAARRQEAARLGCSAREGTVCRREGLEEYRKRGRRQLPDRETGISRVSGRCTSALCYHDGRARYVNHVSGLACAVRRGSVISKPGRYLSRAHCLGLTVFPSAKRFSWVT